MKTNDVVSILEIQRTTGVWQSRFKGQVMAGRRINSQLHIATHRHIQETNRKKIAIKNKI